MQCKGCFLSWYFSLVMPHGINVFPFASWFTALL
jgi:hypothetical protein